ncbi:ZIP family metal transporter [Candidatus Woesearchaeota archaeon]|nr:ZIP family metal transporter [Candidatus Woesearchaeota archaeon]
MILLYIIIATILVSLTSFVGVILGSKHIEKKLHYFVTFAAATLLAVAFFDMIPESLEGLESAGFHSHELMGFVLLGILLFFLVERFIHWHHCGREHGDCERKSASGSLVLYGDFVHNFIDGLLIAGAFLINPITGIFTTLTVLIHEIPQEFGDFAVLIHSGYSKIKALMLNFYSALSAVLGGVLGYFALDAIQGVAPFAVLIAAGGFIYIALSDLVPSLHKHGRETLWKESTIFMITIVFFFYFILLLH